MSKAWHLVIAGVLALAVVFGFFTLKNRFTFFRGENTAVADAAHKEVIALKPVAAKAETLFVHDTVWLRKTVIKYDSSATAYRNARDTTNIKDTAQVKVALAKADTAVANADSVKLACDTTVKHAGRALYTKKELDDAVERENKAIRALIPGRLEKAVTAVKWVSVGVGVGAALVTVLVPHH